MHMQEHIYHKCPILDIYVYIHLYVYMHVTVLEAHIYTYIHAYMYAMLTDTTESLDASCTYIGADVCDCAC